MVKMWTRINLALSLSSGAVLVDSAGDSCPSSGCGVDVDSAALLQTARGARGAEAGWPSPKPEPFRVFGPPPRPQRFGRQDPPKEEKGAWPANPWGTDDTMPNPWEKIDDVDDLADMDRKDLEAAPWIVPPPGDSVYTDHEDRLKPESLEELKEPPSVEMGANGEPIVLKMEKVKLDLPWVEAGEYVFTRGYNGMVPGPTVRMKQGQKVSIELQNKLETAPQCEHLGAMGLPWNPNQICELNTTNLHMHGLHISPNANSDNMFLRVAPGNNFNFEFDIGADHMGGTHWYHPHHHHSSSAQAGGGSFGAIIMEDPPNSLPTEIQNLPEKVMMLAYVDFGLQTRLEEWGIGNKRWGIVDEEPSPDRFFWKSAKGKDLQTAPPALLVNGQYQPKMTVASGQWYRLRMIYAAVETSLVITMNNTKGQNANCELQLLAKDGVFLNQAPRKIDSIYLSSGNRADVLMRCTCEGSKCSAQMAWQGWHQVIGVGPVAPNLAAASLGQMVHIRVDDQKAERVPWKLRNTKPKLPSFSVTRPCYLVDLREATVPDERKHELALPMGGVEQYVNSLKGGDGLKETFTLMIKWDGKGETFMNVNDTPPLTTLDVGEVYEIDAVGIKYHPLHIHVLPFQIVKGASKMNQNLMLDNYFQDGDWHDTLLSVGLNTATLRFAPNYFTGKYLVHCHILEHEDNGMMAYLQVNGKEGTTWSGAKKIDPTCYQIDNPTPGFKLL